MKSLKKQRRIQVIAIMAVALVLSTFLIGYALRDGINFFRSPTKWSKIHPAHPRCFASVGWSRLAALCVVRARQFSSS